MNTETANTPTVDSPREAPAIEAVGLTKRFRSRTAVDGATLSIPAGTVTGLVGPNGAGKTTLLAMLLGLVRPTSGTASVLGEPVSRPARYLPKVGSLIETPAFHPAVGGRDNLRALAALTGQPPTDLDDLIDLVGLTGRGNDPVGSYSLGMKQRLGIAAALLGDPELVILDEPTNGLDPVGMADVRDIVTAIAARGTTVIVSSHLLSELEQICDWLVILRLGGLLYQGPASGFTDGGAVLRAAPADPVRGGELADLATGFGLPVTDDGDGLRIDIAGADDPDRIAAALNEHAHDHGIVLRELHIRRPDLQSRYLEIVAS